MGFGAEVAAVLQEQAFDWLDAPIERVGAKFAPLAFAPAMEQFVVPQPADVLAAIKKTRREGLMATEVKLPRLGQGMESGTIVRWLKAEGDRVEKGEPLYEVDTDKATQEVEAEASGVLLKIAVAEGEVPVGQTVARDRRARRGRCRRADPTRPRRPRGAERPARGRRAPAPSRVELPRRDQRRAATGRRPREGLAARPPDGARARHRARRPSPAPAPTGGSSPRTSSAPRPPRGGAAPPRRPLRLTCRPRSSRCR